MSQELDQVLYVDDEAQNLFAFKASFRRDYKVFTAESAVEGMKILRDNKIKLIIADQRMPEVTGVEFLSQAKLVYPNPIRMILTGFSDVVAVIDAINAGKVYGYYTKPWTKEELKISIQSAIEFYNLQEENTKLFHNLNSTIQELNQTLSRFKKYIPEKVVQDAINATEETLIAGERRNVVALFCDIRYFTEISEAFEPEQVVTLLNEYYAVMTDVVLKHKGIVAQFSGDEVFAVFGAPVSDERKELNAVYCAIEMLEKCKDLNKAFDNILPNGLKIGIGINSGEAIVGNIGSDLRITYSVVGDMVNTAKRIESLTKEHPNTILIRDSVSEIVADNIMFKFWDPISVKGKSEKIKVCEVLGRKLVNT